MNDYLDVLTFVGFVLGFYVAAYYVDFYGLHNCNCSKCRLKDKLEKNK